MKKHRSRIKPNEVLFQVFSRVKKHSIRTKPNDMLFRSDITVIVYLN